MSKLAMGGLVAVLLAGGSAEALTTYQLDDGTAESAFGASDGTTLMVLNRFQEQAGADVITQLGGVWGNNALGVTVSLLLYEDPNDDGDPGDAILLEATNAVGGLQGFSFLEPITPTTIDGTFFVGMLYQTTGGLVAATAIDGDTAAAGRTWVAAAQSGHVFDVNDLTNNDIPVALASSQYAGDPLAMLRAQAVPEPSTALLLCAALAALWLQRPSD